MRLAPVSRAALLGTLLGTVLFGAQGCLLGHGCSTEARATLMVTVLQASDGSRVCDATVTARDGTFSEVLAKFGDATNCTYSGVYERPGTYGLDVVSGARTKNVGGITATADECHVMGREIVVTLDP